MNNIALFVVANLASGFIGWLIGKTGRNAAIAAQVVEEHETEETKGRTSPPFQPNRFAVVAVLIVLLVTVANSAFLTINQSVYTACVKNQFDELADVLKARSAPQQQAQDALDAVMFRTADAYKNPTPEAGQDIGKLIQAYADLRRAAKSDFAKHPLPDPPRDACST